MVAHATDAEKRNMSAKQKTVLETLASPERGGQLGEQCCGIGAILLSLSAYFTEMWFVYNAVWISGYH
jgi:hypothetical protein